MTERRTCRGCGTQETTLEGKSNMFRYVEYCLECIRQEARQMAREARQRFLRQTESAL
jgi:hypothetical protein